jgi:aminopeptidase
MTDPRHTKLANVLVNYSTNVQPGDLVGIAAEPTAMPLIEAVAAAVLKAGGNPIWFPRSEQLTEVLLTHGTDEQLKYLAPTHLDYIEKINVQISFWCQLNTRYLAGIDPAKVALHQAGRRPFMSRFMDRAAETNPKSKLRWCGTAYPTLASAQDADMSLRQYEDFVYAAGLLHLDDPAAAWRTIFARQERVREYLQGKKTLVFTAPAADGHDGTHLTVDVSNSTWINCGGHENFPDGEVFAGPGGADGHVNYTFPAVYNGREVEGVRLVFKQGRVVDASAKKGEDFLIKMLDQDQGARNMGEIAIGTNYAIKQFSKNTLFDEKIGGTFHAAVGAGYPESGNTNQSGLHWDMVCDLRPSPTTPGGTITIDGTLFHKDGQFVNVPGW